MNLFTPSKLSQKNVYIKAHRNWHLFTKHNPLLQKFESDHLSRLVSNCCVTDATHLSLPSDCLASSELNLKYKFSGRPIFLWQLPDIPKSDNSNTARFLNNHRSSISYKFKIIFCHQIFGEIHSKEMTFKYSNFDIPGVRENVAFVVPKCWLRIAATGDAQDKWNLEIRVPLLFVAHKWPVKNHCH